MKRSTVSTKAESVVRQGARGRSRGVDSSLSGQVVRLQRTIGNRAVGFLLRQIQANGHTGGEGQAVPPVVREVVSGSGRPLDAGTRSTMEAQFDRDFGRVRVHDDARAAESAAAVDAAAYTVGSHIVLGANRPDVQSRSGRTLLGHELAHVVQAGSGGASGTIPTRVAPSDAPEEVEAQRAGQAVAAGERIGTLSNVEIGSVARSPLTDELVKGKAQGGKDKGEFFNVLRAKGPIAGDPDLGPILDAAFGPNTDPAKTTDDRWLADMIVSYGPEPRWPHDALVERNRRATANKWAPEPGNIEAAFAVGAGKTPIKAYYFPGTSDKRAMIIGGVHGSEAAGVEIVNLLLDLMRKPNAPMPYYSVIVVPSIFPSNLERRNADLKAGKKIKDADYRKTPGQKDPQRQMPNVGDSPGTTDSTGKAIEPENLVLLDLVERFKPERLASVHGVSNPSKSMFDNNPRPGHEAEDAALTLKLAQTASGMPGGPSLPANKLNKKKPVTQNKALSKNHDPGVSGGEYLSHETKTRPAVNVITVEPGGNQTSAEAKDPKARRIELEAFATVLRDIFLGPP